MTIELRAAVAPWNDSIDFLLTERLADGRRGVAEPMSLRVYDAMSALEPTFSLPRTAAQQLMDNLWTCGLRPSEGTGSAGALAATQAHLKDMQRLVFDKERSE